MYVVLLYIWWQNERYRLLEVAMLFYNDIYIYIYISCHMLCPVKIKSLCGVSEKHYVLPKRTHAYVSYVSWDSEASASDL